MRDNAMTTGVSTQATGAQPGLVCHWVAVTDETGRRHMEARWSAPQVATHATHAA
ncbi:hypothetical protein [Nocardioides sediminis]|uniref:hypothetical protein n=1 Tax=Nocardioides sediminis TaxID=433648 RepID=UPI00131EE044|nr:hypothetical protein [Nocardioides sediminis]